MMPGRLDRWIFAKYLVALLLAALTIIGLYLVADLSQRVDDIIENAGRSGWRETARITSGYYMLAVGRYILEFPDLVFVGAAAALTVGVLKSGAAAAVQGMGRSLQRLLAPMVVVCALFAALQFLAGDVFLPFAVARQESYRARIVGSRAMSGVVFPAEGAGSIVAVGYAAESGFVRDMLVIEREDGGFRMVRIAEAQWDGRGRLYPSGETIVLMGGGIQDAVENMTVAPAAAMRLRLLGSSSVAARELAALGGPKAHAELGARIGAPFILAGAVLLVTGLIARSGGGATAGKGVAAYLAVEFFARAAAATSVHLGALLPSAAIVLGFAPALLLLLIGVYAYWSMPT